MMTVGRSSLFERLLKSHLVLLSCLILFNSEYVGMLNNILTFAFDMVDSSFVQHLRDSNNFILIIDK